MCLSECASFSVVWCLRIDLGSFSPRLRLLDVEVVPSLADFKMFRSFFLFSLVGAVMAG